MKVIEPKNSDVFAWSELVHRFIDECIKDYGWGVNEQDLHRTYYAWDKRFGWLLEHEGKIIGVLAGACLPHFFNYGNTLFQESMWYVVPEHRKSGGGLLLYRACVKQCEKMGITRMVFAHTKHMGEEFGKIYDKLGFTYLETHYEKAI